MIPCENDLKWILEYYGSQHQLLKLTEEMAEATQAIVKYLQEPEEKRIPGMYNHMREELEDVRILLDQAELYLGRDYNVRYAKIQRTIERLKNEKNEEG